MKKIKLFAIIFAAILLFSGCEAPREEFSLKSRVLISDQRYGTDIGYRKYDDGSVIIIDHNGAGNIELPRELDGMPVVELAASLFEGREDITSVKLPDSLEIIGDGAFLGCSALSDVELGKAVWSVGLNAFDGTPWLASLTDEFAIVGDGVLIRYNGTSPSVKLPDGVRHIAGGAFATRQMKAVDLSSVLTVGKGAFAACNKLIHLDLGDSLVLIGESAFQSCVLMEEAVVPKTLLQVRKNAFTSCPELAVVTYCGTDVEFTHLELAEGNEIFAEEALVVYRGGADS